MSLFKEVLADYIRAKLTGGKTRVGNKLSYDEILNYAYNSFTSDDDIPNLRAVKALLGAYGGGVMVPFTTETDVTIDWQIDLPPGFGSAYAVIFGDMMPKPVVYTKTTGHIYTNADSTLTATRSADETQLLTLKLDWGFSADGYIQF